MQPVPFIADSAADAVSQIRARLGPEAVVVNIRPLAARGVSRLWRKTRFEVLAHGPQRTGTGLDLTSDAPAGPGTALPEPATQAGRFVQTEPPVTSDLTRTGGGNWRVGAVLERSGFLPVCAQRVVDRLRELHGENPPSSVAAELVLVRGALANLWRSTMVTPAAGRETRSQVLIGPAGVGKTTSLCKWLAQTVLVEGRSARVYRLDGATANTAESLSVFCDILGVPVSRGGGPGGGFAPESGERVLVDLPGVDWRDPAAVESLGRRLQDLGSPEVHLVLNGAYDAALLLAQTRAFAALPIADLIVTHLDEEPRWGKLWNLVLGTNYSVRFLSAGQNIPGEFFTATPERILSRQFPP